MPNRKPEDLWKKLVEEARDDLVDAAARVSAEQAEKELAAAGCDVAGLTGRGEAVRAFSRARPSP